MRRVRERVALGGHFVPGNEDRCQTSRWNARMAGDFQIQFIPERGDSTQFLANSHRRLRPRVKLPNKPSARFHRFAGPNGAGKSTLI